MAIHPRGYEQIYQVDKNRKPRLIIKRPTPSKRALDRPTQKTVERRKARITLPSLKFQDDTGD
jgi:hypothetical protein